MYTQIPSQKLKITYADAGPKPERDPFQPIKSALMSLEKRYDERDDVHYKEKTGW